MLYLEAIGKALLTFVALWALSRIEGKKMIAHMTLLDFVVAVTFGSMGAQAMVPGNPPLPILVGTAVFAGTAILFSLLDLRGQGLETLLDSEPVVLIENGKILEENLRRNRMTMRQLEVQLRLKGYFSLSLVEFAILETNGEISVLPKSQYRPVQPSDLGAQTSYEGLSTQVMHEGRTLPERLRGAGLSEAWLREELHKQGIQDPGEVFSAWLGSDGSLLVDRYNDMPPQQAQSDGGGLHP